MGTTNDPIVLIVIAIGVLGFIKLNSGNRGPLYPWNVAASSAYVALINETHDDLQVYAEAPEVDNATRFIGYVLHCDSAKIKSPYLDTKVRFLIVAGNTMDTIVIKMNKPNMWRVVYPLEHR